MLEETAEVAPQPVQKKKTDVFVENEEQAVLDAAQTEAERILAEAREKAKYLINEATIKADVLLKQAEEKAQEKQNQVDDLLASWFGVSSSFLSTRHTVDSIALPSF